MVRFRPVSARAWITETYLDINLIKEGYVDCPVLLREAFTCAV